jgi:hypothetical protein
VRRRSGEGERENNIEQGWERVRLSMLPMNSVSEGGRRRAEERMKEDDRGHYHTNIAIPQHFRCFRFVVPFSSSFLPLLLFLRLLLFSPASS